MSGEGVILARFGELWLKGKNRGDFEKRLHKNVRQRLADLDPEGEVVREHGLLVLRPTRRFAEVGKRLEDVFGIGSISPARRSALDLAEMARHARELVDERLEALPDRGPLRFRVETRRSDKRFPHDSTAINVAVADHVLAEHGARLTVDLENPELVVGVSVRAKEAFVFVERRPGAGGLPVGSIGRAVALLSGGIDSPVASWMTMKRGARVVFLAFHSYPWVGDAYRHKVERIVRRLARYQNGSLLYFTPLAPLQEAVREVAPESYRTVLYRRAMQRIASIVAKKEKAGALVTGESLGQVASQTMQNLACIEAASSYPVLRPLIAFDKAETIELARRIGTFDLSIEPQPDCCTVFQPKRPILHGSPEVCASIEGELDLERLIREAIDGTESLVIDP